jgi:hypothetical protein
MGFRFSSFLAGATKGAADVLEEDQASAAKSASFGVKALKENYDRVMAENRTLETKLSKNMKFLKENDSTATDAELFAAATNDVFMQHAVEAAKANPGKFRVADFVSIKDANASKMTREELMRAYTEIPAVAQAARQAEESSGNFIANLRKRVSSSAATRAEEQTAKAMGVSIEQLRSAEGFKRPEIDTGAEFDLTKFQKEKGYDEREKDAKLALLKAEQSGNVDAINVARADVMIFSKIKETLTSEQQQFSNKVADIKNRYMFGDDKTRKAAKPEYDKLMSDVRAEAMAKKVTKDGEDEGKIPALSTLNTFTSAAVARAVAAKHGDLIKTKQLAIVEKADGSVGIDYIGDSDVLRRQILETQANAARNALSLYTDANGQPFNRDVASVLNSFTSIVPSIMRDSNVVQTPAVATPASQVRSFNSVKEAEDANLPKGTKITINGRPAEVQ